MKIEQRGEGERERTKGEREDRIVKRRRKEEDDQTDQNVSRWKNGKEEGEIEENCKN